MKRYKKNYSALAVTAAFASLLLSGSCSDDMDGFQAETPYANICFNISRTDGSPGARTAATDEFGRRQAADTFLLRAADESDSLCVTATVGDFDPAHNGDSPSMSRAALVSKAAMHNSFGVTACIRSGDNQTPAYYFFNEKIVNKSGTETGWIYDDGDTYFWPGADHTLRFYAYAPYTCDGLTPPAVTSSGATPEFSYSVPDDAGNQTDLLAADSGEKAGDTNTSVPLQFKHICTAVEFVDKTSQISTSIKSITIDGAFDSGTFSFDTWSWNLSHSTSAFTRTLSGTDSQENDGKITPDDNCFVMLPQTLPDGAMIKIVVHDSATGTDRTLSAPIAGHIWPQGKRVTYSISVSPDYKFELTDLPETLDAHYIIFRTTVKASEIADSKAWTMTAPSFDDGAVTIVSQNDMNEFARQGFWTDRIVNAKGFDEGSARGQSEFHGTGPGEFPIAVFIPENAGNEIRTIPLTIRFDGEEDTAQTFTLTQHCPAWVDGSGFGWEQTDDNLTGEFGFNWNRTVYYGYLYSASLLGNSSYKNYCQSVIDNNNAQSYSSVETYSYSTLRLRYCIKIDYSKLNSMEGYGNSSADGLSNTKELFGLSGTATTNTFEEIVMSILKTEAGHTTQKAFRLGNGESGEAPAPSGDNISGSPAVGECMKKNRYNLLTTISQEGDIAFYTQINEADIVWYLPAVDQFSSVPASVTDIISASEYWSSTVDMSGTTGAYIGNATLQPRSTIKKVRACRNRPQ